MNDIETMCHQSYLASVTRRTRSRRIRDAHYRQLMWCALAILYIITVFVVVSFKVYDG